MYKRFEVRRDTTVPVVVFFPDWASPRILLTGDLSPRGLYLQTDDIVMTSPETPLICSFSLNRPYHLSARVCRVNPLRRRSDTGRPGFGVEFVHVRPLTRISLRSDLRGLPPPIPRPRTSGIRLQQTGRFVSFETPDTPIV
jgi:hypothetical protein